MGSEQYQVLGTLGSGATGTVYLANAVELDREVAYKELGPALAADPGFLERFRAEARVMAGLDHPNCVRVYDFFEEPGRAVLVSEYVPGASLRQVLDHAGHLTPEQSLGVLKGALTGLAYAHGRGLVHRDIKPENLLADEEGVSKLADFGQALVGSAGPGAAGGMPAGSPAYMSPEMVSGGAVDLRTDIYSCGAMLFEFLTGRAAFTGDNPLAVMRKHLSEPPPDPRALNSDLPEGVGALVTRALAIDPGQRQRTAEQFLDELEAAAVAGYGADWEQRSSIKRLVAAAAAALGLLLAGGAAVMAAAADVGEATVGGGISRWMIAGGLAAAVVLVGGIGALAGGLFGSSHNTGGVAVAGSPTPSASPSDTPSPSPEVSPSPSPSPSRSPSPSPSPSPKPSASHAPPQLILDISNPTQSGTPEAPYNIWFENCYATSCHGPLSGSSGASAARPYPMPAPVSGAAATCARGSGYPLMMESFNWAFPSGAAPTTITVNWSAGYRQSGSSNPFNPAASTQYSYDVPAQAGTHTANPGQAFKVPAQFATPSEGTAQYVITWTDSRGPRTFASNSFYWDCR